MAKQYTVTMPDGSTRTVLANSQAAANNNVGLPASGAVSQAPASTPASVAGSSYTPPTYTPAASGNLPPAADPGGQLFQTKNGPRTATQMMNELFAVGWNGTGEIKDVYARTTGGAVTPTSGTAGPAPIQPAVAPAPAPLQTNLDANQQLLNNAEKQAYQAYLNAKLNLDTDDLAFRKATQAFSNTISEAGITGTYQGAPTLAAQQQKFSQDVSLANLTGTYNGQPTEAARQANNQTAVSYLGLIKDLKGPGDYSTYLRTLGSTPGGLRDLVASASGQYVPASGATTGVAPTPASLGGLVNAAATGASGGLTYPEYMRQTQGLPAPNQIAPASWNAYSTSQKQMLLDAYQAQGWNPQDAQDLYAASLPKYAGQSNQPGVVKL